MFQVATRPESQLLLGALTQVSQREILAALEARWVLSGDSN
jgi:hypothetical protein